MTTYCLLNRVWQWLTNWNHADTIISFISWRVPTTAVGSSGLPRHLTLWISSSRITSESETGDSDEMPDPMILFVVCIWPNIREKTERESLCFLSLLCNCCNKYCTEYTNCPRPQK